MRISYYLLISLALISSAEAETVFPVNINDDTGFIEAMQHGDIGKIDSLYNSATSERSKKLFEAGRLRLSSNIKASATSATQCYTPNQKMMTDKDSMISMFCGLIVAEDALNNGDIAVWAKTMEAIKEKFLPEYTKEANFVVEGLRKKLKIQGQPTAFLQKIRYQFDFLSLVKDYVPFEKWPYITNVLKKNDENNVIPLIWHSSISQGHQLHIPYIKIKINNKTIEGIVDTGTEDNLLLDQKTAQSLGITQITPDWIITHRLGGEEQRTSLANAESVLVGNMLLQNLPVTITDTGSAPSIIGLNLLRQLGNITVSARQLTINSHTTSSCTIPMIMESPVKGSFGLVTYAIHANKDLVKNSLIDTGTPVIIYGIRDKVTLPAPAIHIESNSKDVPYNGGRADFEISEVRYPRQSFPVFQGHSIFNYGIGSTLLHHNIIEMDFNNSHLCITSKTIKDRDLNATAVKAGD